MKVVIHKSARMLTLWDGGQQRLRCRIALGSQPVGHKQHEGDGRTPEGSYRICLVKENGKYGRSLGLSYPNVQDAQRAFADGCIDQRTLDNIRLAQQQGRRPPWGSPLGGEIYVHEGGTESDWTQGCIALDNADMDVLFPLRDQIDTVEIMP